MRLIKNLAFAAAACGLLVGTATVAEARLILTIDDLGTGIGADVIVIDDADGGVGDPTAAGNATDADGTAGDGVISFFASPFGPWIGVEVTVTSTSVLGFARPGVLSIDYNVVSGFSVPTEPFSLVITATDDSYNFAPGTAYWYGHHSVTGTTSSTSPVAVSVESAVDPAGAEFATTTPVASLGPLPGSGATNADSGTDPLPGPVPTNFSITQSVTITQNGTLQATAGNSTVTVAEPALAASLGLLGLMGIAAMRRR